MAAMTGLVLLLWAGVTVASQVDLHKRIYGGRDCGATERPHHVVLTSTSAPLYFCGGTLISDQWVLTAAHCYKPGWKLKATLGKLRNPTEEHDITDQPVVYTDPQTNEKHDIMLLKLPKKTALPRAVLPLDCSGHPNNGEQVTVSGRSRTSSSPGDIKVTLRLDLTLPLQCLDIKVVTCDNCSINNAYVYPNTFCYEEAGKDTTPGDSGGGVMYRCTLYGVHVAGGTELCRKHSIAVKVCEKIYLDWIKKTTGIQIP